MKKDRFAILFISALLVIGAVQVIDALSGARVSGYPWLNESVTFVEGDGITLLQSGTNITVSEVGNVNKSGDTMTGQLNITGLKSASAVDTYWYTSGTTDYINFRSNGYVTIYNDDVSEVFQVQTGSGSSVIRALSSAGVQMDQVSGSNYGSIGTAGSHPAYLYTNNGEKVGITVLGNNKVGVNTTSPATPFHVNGNITFEGITAEASSYDALCRDSATGQIYFASGLTTCLVSKTSAKENITYDEKSYSKNITELKVINYQERYKMLNRSKLTSKNYENNSLTDSIIKTLNYSSLDDTYYDVYFINRTGLKSEDVTNSTFKGIVVSDGLSYEQLSVYLLKVVQEQQVVLSSICSKNQTLCEVK